MASGKSALLQLLERNSVKSEVSEYLTKAGCLSVAQLANWVDKKEDLLEAVLKRTDLKDDQSQLASLKMAWREAEAVTSRGLKRATEALPPEDADAPLDSEEQKSVEQRFRQLYNWPSLPPRQIGSDSLLGRVQREFNRRQPTQLAVSRVRTLAASQKGNPPKQRRLTESVSILWGAVEEDTSSVSGLYAYLALLRVLATTWAVAGSFTAEDNSGNAGIFAHWAETSEYEQMFSERAHAELALHTEDSVVHWITEVEEEVRARAIEFTRGPGQLLWGRALQAAVREADKWAEKRHLLSLRKPPGNFFSDVPAPPAVPPKGGGKGTGKKGAPLPNRRKWKHAHTTSAGATICKRYNDARGCSGCNTAHVCDVMVKGNRACGQKGHTRMTHDAERHGVPMT